MGLLFTHARLGAAFSATSQALIDAQQARTVIAHQLDLVQNLRNGSFFLYLLAQEPVNQLAGFQILCV